MINVNVFFPAISAFESKGYWFDFEERKITFRNPENKPIFEIIRDQTNHRNILLTMEEVCYAELIEVAYSEKGPILYCLNKNEGMKQVHVAVE